MFQVIGASSLERALQSDPEIKDSLGSSVFAKSSYSLNPRVTNPELKALTLINSPAVTNKKVILWHDLINNSLTAHHSNDNKTLPAQELVSILKKIPHLFAVVHCKRDGAPDIFAELLALKERNVFIIDVPTHILSRTESENLSVRRQYQKLHQSGDQELRTLSVILHYFPDLKKLYRTRTRTPRPSKSRRKAKQNAADSQ